MVVISGMSAFAIDVEGRVRERVSEDRGIKCPERIELEEYERWEIYLGIHTSELVATRHVDKVSFTFTEPDQLTIRIQSISRESIPLRRSLQQELYERLR